MPHTCTCKQPMDGLPLMDLIHGAIVALRINSSIDALNAYRHLSVVPADQAGAAKAVASVGTAARVAAAAADGSGLSVTETLRAQLSGLSQASRGAQTGLAVAQTADGALANTQTLLTRMRDLTVQASAAVVATAALAGITTEVGALNSTIDTIASTTSYGTQQLLDGGFTGSFNIGAAQGPVVMTIAAATSTALGVSQLDLSSPAGAAVATQAVQGALDQVSATRSTLGRFKDLFTGAVSRITVAVQNVTSAVSSIADGVKASDISGLARTQILAQPSAAMAAQGGEGTAALMRLLA